MPADEYVGVDIDNSFTRLVAAADCFYDGKRIPYADEYFDSVLCSQVLEHVFNPEEFLSEIRRVLRPGGKLLLTVPFVWDEHEQPADFGRYSSFGIRALLERHGFSVEELRKSVCDAEAISQLVAAWLCKAIRLRNRWGRMLSQILLVSPVTLVGALIGRVLPGRGDIYLDNVVLATKALVD